ncbi:MAG TPA: hypothetical protein VLE91_02675, partial [Candidatus Saccharimonadales bacterium]|nr:hypothetical protein [Candidatus Saccharimonadales bacterium]
SGYVDSLYLVEISPEFADRELWAAEIIKVARMIKKASLKREISTISSQLSVVQKSGDEAKLKKLLVEFAKVSEEVKGLNISKA